MFQTFDSLANPAQGPARLALLRDNLRKAGLTGFIIPRADLHQGEYVAARDERLQWLTGFTGSAGFCVVLPDIAGVFIDGRYRTQVKVQVDLDHFTPVPWPEISAGAWISQHLPSGIIGFDPWLHTADEIAKLEAAGVALRPVENMIDAIWTDQPAPPLGMVFVHPVALAGKTSADKRAELAEDLRKAGQKSCVLTLPDSICWLLNLRGADVPRNPILHATAILHDDGRVDLFADARKFTPAVLAELGGDIRLTEPQTFPQHLIQLTGPVRLDRVWSPKAIAHILESAGTQIIWADDPARLPKAIKNDCEINGMREAHLRDGAAMVEFLAWLDQQTPNPDVTEIDIVRALEGFRRATNALHDISFESIVGAGPHGAIMHYRVSYESNRKIGSNGLLLVDSGGQYLDGTTDITRTIAVGDAGDYARACYTRVLQGVIAISRARWPKGLAGRDLDPLARVALWMAGQDFNHGTGHGVGAFLSVHEGPQRLSRISEVVLEAGMILSNEPGYYREGEFGIRLENLIVVQPAPALAGGDPERAQLCFENLTFAPFDRRLIVNEMLSNGERDWINAYHREVLDKLGPRLSEFARDWCVAACAAL
jgi:Xaa-Pro aminopeptidase